MATGFFMIPAKKSSNSNKWEKNFANLFVAIFSHKFTFKINLYANIIDIVINIESLSLLLYFQLMGERDKDMVTIDSINSIKKLQFVAVVAIERIDCMHALYRFFAGYYKIIE